MIEEKLSLVQETPKQIFGARVAILLQLRESESLFLLPRKPTQTCQKKLFDDGFIGGRRVGPEKSG